MIGFILSCYTLACLCIRPFSGYMLDTFSRKPLYLLAYFVFTVIFGGYMLAGALVLFIALRIVHGFAFGMVSVAGNTIVIDILPSSRRGEGLGYYGLANNIAMSFGPMTGLFMHGHCSYAVIFTCSLVSGSLGFIMASLVKTPFKQPVKREPISLDRFFSCKGITGRYFTFIAFYSVWDDYQLRGYVCRRNRDRGELGIVLHFYGCRFGGIPYLFRQTGR